MDENSSALSQDAIDELLDSQVTDETEGAAEQAAEPSADLAVAEPETEDAPAADPEEEGLTDAESEVEAEDLLVAEPATDSPPEEESPEPEPVLIAAPPPPGITPPPGVVHIEQSPSEATGTQLEGISEEQARVIAGEASQAAITPLHNDIGAISNRVDALEAALQKIKRLEGEIARLKSQDQAAQGLKIEDLQPLVDRLLALEQSARKSPLHNLYDRFDCSECRNHGAAQARVRCRSCGTEGWFGRKESA